MIENRKAFVVKKTTEAFTSYDDPVLYGSEEAAWTRMFVGLGTVFVKCSDNASPGYVRGYFPEKGPFFGENAYFAEVKEEDLIGIRELTELVEHSYGSVPESYGAYMKKINDAAEQAYYEKQKSEKRKKQQADFAR